MKRRALLLAVPCVALAEPELAARIQARLRQAPLLRGRFEQEKALQGFAQPLKSSGDYLLLRGKGLLWRTAKPFASQLVVTREAIRSEGAGAFRLDAQREPAVRLITTLLLALLDGNLAALQAQFELTGRDGANWKAELVPQAPALAKLFTRIELDGDSQVRRIRLLEAQGDSTLIRFAEQSEQPAQLTTEESKALE